MERIRDAFLTLLRAGLWEDQAQDTASCLQDQCFPLSAEEWSDVLLMARSQTVIGLVFSGISRLPDELMPQPEQLALWAAETDGLERRNRGMNAVLTEFAGKFIGAGLHPVLQKGQGVARLYAQPLLRRSGDIDLFFPEPGENAKALELIRKEGIQINAAADGSHCYRYRNVIVEHHPDLLDICRPAAKRKIGEEIRRFGYVGSGIVPGLRVPHPALNLLLLSTHILKHAMGKGIGLRQLCDYARACFVYSGGNSGHKDGCSGMPEATQDLWPEMARIYREAGVTEWTNLLHSFVTEYLGLPPECTGGTVAETGISGDGDSAANSDRVAGTGGAIWKYTDPSPLMKIVESGGNFGQYAGLGKRRTGTPASTPASAAAASGKEPAQTAQTATAQIAQIAQTAQIAQIAQTAQIAQPPLKAHTGKLHTAMAFVKRFGFSFRYAPGEAVWQCLTLIRGQFSSKKHLK